MAGKGDRYRPVNLTVYRLNYDQVFGTCTQHPKYAALRPPTADCAVCRRLWRESSHRESVSPDPQSPFPIKQ